MPKKMVITVIHKIKNNTLFIFSFLFLFYRTKTIMLVIAYAAEVKISNNGWRFMEDFSSWDYLYLLTPKYRSPLLDFSVFFLLLAVVTALLSDRFSLLFLFMMATVLIIYYKQISEGYDDHDRFEIMKKVGMSKKEIKNNTLFIFSFLFLFYRTNL